MSHEKVTSVALFHLQEPKVTQPSLELARQPHYPKVPELGGGAWGDGAAAAPRCPLSGQKPRLDSCAAQP